MPYYMELTGGNVAKSQQLTSDYARTGLDPYRTFTAPDGSTYNGLTNT